MTSTRTVLFVAPFYLETTLRFLKAVAEHPDVHCGLISQEPLERLPSDVRGRLAGHYRVADALDAGRLAEAVRALASRLGEPHRLLGVLEHLQVPLAEVRQALGIPGMGPRAAENFRDKSRMKQVLAAAGLPCARHALAERPEEALELAARVGFPLVLKPPAGAGAASTFRVDGPDELRSALAHLAPRPEAPVLVEEFVTGEEHSFDSVFIHGQPVWCSVTQYLPAPLEVLRNPWIQWCVLLPREVDHPRYDDIRRSGFEALAALGMDTGLSHMEWFRKRDGSLAISEVGARPPGARITHLLSWAHDLDFYRAWARLMVDEVFSPPQRRWAAGAAYLRGQGAPGRRGRVVAIHGLEEAQRELGSLVVEASLPRRGQTPSGSYEGDGYVILRHPETEVVRQALHTIVSRIRVEVA